MSRIVARYPASGSVQGGSVAAQEAATAIMNALHRQTGEHYTVEWHDEYNDHSFTGHYNIVEH